MKKRLALDEEGFIVAPEDWDLADVIDTLNAEVGDIPPGPERAAKMLDVFTAHKDKADTDEEKRFWQAMIDAPSRLASR